MEQKNEKMIPYCATCKYKDLYWTDFPCVNCTDFNDNYVEDKGEDDGDSKH